MTVGLVNMEVEHFNPKFKKRVVQDYNNLMLSTGHCNRSKGAKWPTPKQLKLGIHFLNPCEEMDYGVHIYESPATHELVGVTPAGRWQISMLDLNAPHLIHERRTRSAYRAFLERGPARIKGTMLEIQKVDEMVRCMREQIELMIPVIAAPPK